MQPHPAPDNLMNNKDSEGKTEPTSESKPGISIIYLFSLL